MVVFTVLFALIHLIVANEGVKIFAPKMNKHMEPPPNIDYLARGYDIFLGNPLSMEGIDSGFRQPIFVQDNYDYLSKVKFLPEGDGYILPNGFYGNAAEACQVSYDSRTVTDMKSYREQMSYSVSVAGYLEYSFINSAKGAFSFSMDGSSVEEGTKNSQKVFVYSTASCSVYTCSIKKFGPPRLDSAFLNAVRALPRHFNGHSKQAYFDFIEMYGTHIITELTMGSKLTIKSEFTREKYTKLTESSISVKAGCSFEGSYGAVSGGIAASAGYKKNKKNYQAVDNARTKKSTFSIGARPPENQDSNTWAAQAALNPVPIKYIIDELPNYYVYGKGGRKHYIIADGYKRNGLKKAIGLWKNQLASRKKKMVQHQKQKVAGAQKNLPWFKKHSSCPDGWRIQRTGTDRGGRYIFCQIDSMKAPKISFGKYGGYKQHPNSGICFKKKDNPRHQASWDNKNQIKVYEYTVHYPLQNRWHKTSPCSYAKHCKVEWSSKCKNTKINGLKSHWSFYPMACPDGWVRVGYQKVNGHEKDFVVCRVPSRSWNRGKCSSVAYFPRGYGHTCQWAFKTCKVNWGVCNIWYRKFFCPPGWKMHKNGACYRIDGSKRCSPARFNNKANEKSWGIHCKVWYFPGSDKFWYRKGWGGTYRFKK